MALTEAQKIRLRVAFAHTRRDGSWITMRQFCMAESAAETPDYQGLKEFILGMVEDALNEDIQAGVTARKAQKP